MKTGLFAVVFTIVTCFSVVYYLNVQEKHRQEKAYFEWLDTELNQETGVSKVPQGERQPPTKEEQEKIDKMLAEWSKSISK